MEFNIALALPLTGTTTSVTLPTQETNMMPNNKPTFAKSKPSAPMAVFKALLANFGNSEIKIVNGARQRQVVPINWLTQSSKVVFHKPRTSRVT